jgi:MFS family permease
LYLGTFIIKSFCDRYGEHKGMIILDILAVFGLLLQGISFNLWLIYIGRFLVGIYVGVSSGMIPVYLISLSPPEISGITGSFNQLMITVGIAFGYYFGLAVQDFQISHSFKWGYVMCFPVLMCILRTTTLFFYK